MEKLRSYKPMTAGSVPASPTIFLFLLIWWFAVVSNAGDATFFEYVKHGSCNIFQKRYASIHMKVTNCTWKDDHYEEIKEIS